MANWATSPMEIARLDYEFERRWKKSVEGEWLERRKAKPKKKSVEGEWLERRKAKPKKKAPKRIGICKLHTDLNKCFTYNCRRRLSRT